MILFQSFERSYSCNNLNGLNILKGFAMGTSDLVPGVSGGTIALLLGIYNQFIASISGIFLRRFWLSFTFLIPDYNWNVTGNGITK